MVTSLVDPEVTRQKFSRELEQWKAHGLPRERGWLLLSHDEGRPSVEIGFLGRVAISAGTTPLPIVVAVVRLDYDNYDLLPPSLTFIDAFSRQPAKPHVGAFLPTPEGLRNVLIDGHPLTKQPFLCIPGIREYHTHPQHTGDSWLLHRGTGEGSMLTICERVWRLMANNIVGLSVTMQSLPVLPMRAQLKIVLTQGEMEPEKKAQPAA